MSNKKDIINIIILSIIVILIYFLLKYLNNYNKVIIDSTGFLEKNILSIKKCNELIKLSKNYIFTIDKEPVDDKPVYQIDIITSRNNIENPNLWKEIQPIYTEKLIPIMNKIRKHLLIFHEPRETDYFQHILLLGLLLVNIVHQFHPILLS